MEKIGRYEVQGLIGEGEMARVYRARDPKINRTVAIKILKEEHVDEEYLTRFLREAKAAGAISHPNIVTVYDVGRVKNRSFITMEFLDEKSLADVLAQEHTLPIKHIVSIGIQLARALDHAHAKGIVHRDIKPGNILLMDEGRTAKITDFGIARLDNSGDLQKTHVGKVLGTPRYMSPEQATGLTVDGRSDLFSLGLVLYELLTGKNAFESNNIATLVMQICREDPTPIKVIAPDVPDGLQRIVMKLLNKSPEQRFQTGAQLAHALEREHAALIAHEEDAPQNRLLPLRLKLAAISGAILAFLLFISLAVADSVEWRLLQAQVLDSGASLAKFVAIETAVPVLSEDWVPLELFVSDAGERGSFDYLVVADHQHIVKASTNKDLIGKPFVPPTASELLIAKPDITASSVTLPDEQAAFLFDTPILFQKTEIGRIYLGIKQSAMQSVLRSTLMLMFSLGMIAVLAVLGMTYIFAGLLARPIRLLRHALMDFGRGDLDRRIAQRPNDEVGQLFSAFNHMAESIQSLVSNSQDGKEGGCGAHPDLAAKQALSTCGIENPGR